MRFLSKFFSKDSIFHRKPSSFLLFDFYCPRESHFSTHSKSSKKRLSSPKASKSKRTSLKRSSSPSLYQNITQIISLDEATVNASSSEELRSFSPEVEMCSQGACFNAQEKENFEIDEQKIDGSPVSDVVPEENSVVEDVSPVVHRITQVVRAELSGVCMEERLDELCLSVSPEIVEKVLKRCFKVGHLALRFFYWVKGQPGFRHTTETYNVMLCIAGEGKEFDLMEKLMREMDEELCLNNVKTWTILVSRYGNANKVGKALWAFDQMRKLGCCPDKGVYEALLHALLNGRKSELAVEFYNEMVLQNLRIDRKLYVKLITCLSMSGHMDEVRLVWNDMLKFSQVPVGEVYTCVLRSLCIAGKVEEAKEVFEEIKTKYPSVQPNAYEILVKGLCRVGNMADAVKLVDDMKHSSVVDSQVYGCLIDGFLRKNDSQKALELLHCSRKSGTLLAVNSYTQMIQHLFTSDEYEKACELYDDMLEDGIEPDVVAMTAMVAGHVRNHCISKAWEVFESMKQKVIRPSWKAYTVFIKELCKASEPNEAVKLLNEMSESNINAGEDIVHLVECSLTRKGYVEKAKEVQRMFGSFKPHVQDERSLFVAHEVSNSFAEPHVRTVQTSDDYAECSDSDVEYVCKVISSSTDWSSTQEALEKSTIRFTPELVRVALQNCQMHGSAALNFFSWVGNQAGYRHDTKTYDMAIKIAGSGKDFSHMRNLYREMKRRGCTITPNTWTIMISQYGQAGLTEISLKMYKEMKSEGHQPNGSTYKFLIVFLCGKKGRKVEEAIKIFQEMINAGYMPDREMLGTYLSSLCESGKLEHARKAVKSLCKRGFMPQLGYSLLIKSMCRAGKLEEALNLADEMEHLGCKMDQYVYGSIVHAFLRSGNLDKALDKLEEMKRAGIAQSVQINTSLIVHFCKEKQIEKAIDIFKSMIVDGCEPTTVTYSSIIRGYMNMGMVLDAWCVFWRMKLKGPCPDFETYSMFITCLCKLGRSEEGLQLLNEMLQNGIVPSAVNFRTVFHGLNREGKANLAHNVLQTKWFLNRNRKFSV
ncbi:putative tetratricopeptide-like helical domain superfamily [Dioscorea sansibarensis]